MPNLINSNNILNTSIINNSNNNYFNMNRIIFSIKNDEPFSQTAKIRKPKSALKYTSNNKNNDNYTSPKLI